MTRMVRFFLLSTYTVVLDLDLLDVKVREPTLKIRSDKQSGSAPWASSPWLGGGGGAGRCLDLSLESFVQGLFQIR